MDKKNAPCPQELKDEGKGSAADDIFKQTKQWLAERGSADCVPEAEFRAFLSAAFTGMAGVMIPGAVFYVFYSDSETVAFRQALEGAGLGVHQTCIWAKNAAVLGRSDYQNDYEPVLFGYEQEHEAIAYGWENAGAHRWFADRKQHTVWHFDRPTKSKYHPTMKPLELLAYAIANSSMPGEVVLDPFSGSGSTLMACEQMGRTCLSMELDPRYVDLTVKRWKAMYGAERVLVQKASE